MSSSTQERSTTRPQSGRALILVDIQNDFLPPSGSLAVPEGRAILPLVHSLIEDGEWDLICASLVTHPSNHISFASQHEGHSAFEEIHIPLLNSKEGAQTSQMLWPDHCIPESKGWELEEGVKTRLDAKAAAGLPVELVRKGTNQALDSYSAFADNQYTSFTSLSRLLFSTNITHLTVVGLAADYCVRATCVDARKFGFEVELVWEGTKAVGQGEEVGRKLREELEGVWGVKVV
ncbi:Isochorismatase-like protein [Mrakia frigida]|uniref:nicotinamidase n=1 Tax=Mrakia frigida TaxID=29902 RepID=UPI003FCC1C8E